MQRFDERLAGLPVARLIELAAAGMRASPQVRALGDELMAQHRPVPAWAVNEVLVSADLVGFLMASLSLRECHAMAVCKTWKHAWQERPRPKLVHVRDYVTTVPYDDRGAALPGRGLLYPDYDECCLKLFSPPQLLLLLTLKAIVYYEKQS